MRARANPSGVASFDWPLLAMQVAAAVALLLLWEYGPQDVKIFSRPSLVAKRLVTLWIGVRGLEPLWLQVIETVSTTLVGLAIGVLAGYAMGLLLAEFPLLGATAAPFLAAINSVPRVAWIPVLTLLFGFGLTTKIVLSSLMVCLAVLFNAYDAASHAPRSLLRGVRALGAGRWHTLLHVRAWSAIGATVAALPTGIAYALVGVVFAESLSGETGLGSLIFSAAQRGSADDLGVGAVMLGLVGVVLMLVVRTGQRTLFAHLPQSIRGERL